MSNENCNHSSPILPWVVWEHFQMRIRPWVPSSFLSLSRKWRASSWAKETSFFVTSKQKTKSPKRRTTALSPSDTPFLTLFIDSHFRLFIAFLSFLLRVRCVSTAHFLNSRYENPICPMSFRIATWLIFFLQYPSHCTSGASDKQNVV